MIDEKNIKVQSGDSCDSQSKQKADSEPAKQKKTYEKEKELFKKGFKIGQKVGLVAVTITGLTSGVGIVKTIVTKVIKRN